MNSMINNLKKIKASFQFYLDTHSSKYAKSVIRVYDCFDEKNIKFENWSMYW